METALGCCAVCYINYGSKTITDISYDKPTAMNVIMRQTICHENNYAANHNRPHTARSFNPQLYTTTLNCYIIDCHIHIVSWIGFQQAMPSLDDRTMVSTAWWRALMIRWVHTQIAHTLVVPHHSPRGWCTGTEVCSTYSPVWIWGGQERVTCIMPWPCTHNGWQSLCWPPFVS